MKGTQNALEKKYNKYIWILSVVIPVAVAVLFRVRLPNVEPLSFLPPVYASVNALTAALLVMAVLAVSNVVISSIRKMVPPRIRIIVQLVVIATMVIIVDEVLKAIRDQNIQAAEMVGNLFYQALNFIGLAQIGLEGVTDSELDAAIQPVFDNKTSCLHNVGFDLTPDGIIEAIRMADAFGRHLG